METFLCKGEWDGRQEAELVFESDSRAMIVRLHPARSQFFLGGKPVGWSELLPSLPVPPVPITLYRNKFRWSLMAGRRLVAFAFADEPATRKWSGAEDLIPTEPVPQRSLVPLGWKRVELGDGSTAFSPPDKAFRGASPVIPEGQELMDISSALEFQPNGARSVGLGVCWGEEGGYLWRWMRQRDGMKWQLAVVVSSELGYDFIPLYEEPSPVAPTEWHQIQIWRSGDQLWAGVDGKVLVHARDNRFALGKIIVWVESGDLPPPLVRSVRLTHWWCASLSVDVDTYIPLLAQLGEWEKRTGGWELRPITGQPFALSLLGEPDLPSWWVVDISWQKGASGLVFGWIDEAHYHLLRLKASPKSTNGRHATFELVAIREGKERVLDKWNLLLEPDGLYRLAVQLMSNRVIGFINGMGLVSAEISPVGKVGLWTDSSVTLKQFWLYRGEESLLPLTPESGGTVQPIGEHPVIAYETISITLPAGLPPNVPLSARLSQEPVTLFVERRGGSLIFRLEREGRILGSTSTPLPSRLPITIRLERCDKLLLIWLGNQPVLTVRLP